MNKKSLAELLALAKRQTTLTPQEVIAWAKKHPGSALHAAFEWNDTIAAEQYRIVQARSFLRLLVEVPEGSKVPVRILASLRQDRGGEGYRFVQDILSDANQKAALLQQFLDEMIAYEQRYKHLQELAGVFKAISRVRDKTLKKAA